ncbi:tyrosine-type recombinase/integrase [Pengzhenrongella sp.]|uniref:tyrosine-type recombinase/integrase n=1 Tax=Pengzhenrongella sp. TaxID=2888820 RepID=UPI002F921454
MTGVRDGLVKRGATWSYVIRVTDPTTGKSRPRWVGGFPTEKAAKKARDEARVKAARGEYVDRSRMTLAQYLPQWLDMHAVEIKPQTLAGYRDLLDRYVVPSIGHQRVQALQPAMFTKLDRDLLDTGGVRGQGLSRRTVDYVHAILRKALNDAVRVDQVLTSNPVDRAMRPRREPLGPRTVWSGDELSAFLAVAEQHRLFPFFRLAAFSGGRRGELLNLRWPDVDLDASRIRIRGTTAVIAGVRVEGTTKGGRERTVTLDAGTVAVLRAHRARQNADRLVAGPDWAPGNLVFTRNLGLPIYPDTVSQLVPRFIEQYNSPREGSAPAVPLPHARLHDLRHVHATILLLAGVPVHVVAARLGHADPSITLRVYAHVLHEDAVRVADVFASAMLPTGARLSGAVSKSVSKDADPDTENPARSSRAGL